MDATISEAIAQRRSALERRRDLLRAELEPILDELRGIAAAETALRGKPAIVRRRSARTRQPPTPDSIQGLCLAAITARPGSKWHEIQAWIRENRARDVARSSLAPKLTALCADRWAENRGGAYHAVSGAESEPG